MTEDHERLDWLERAATELKISISFSHTGYFEIRIGRVCVTGPSLRRAIEEAMQATKG